MMWQHWLLKQGRGVIPDDDSTKGPAPPAAVAAAAKIALSHLGVSPESGLRCGENEKPESDLVPVESADDALLERSISGTLRRPEFDETLRLPIDEWFVVNDSVTGLVDSPSASVSFKNGPLDDPMRRGRNLQWVRKHYRSLNEIGRLPFNDADLWQLHQYYYSPPFDGDDTKSVESVGIQETSPVVSFAIDSVEGVKPSIPNARLSASISRLKFDINAESDFAGTHKRGSSRQAVGDMTDAFAKHAPKKLRMLPRRIEYYPRIKVGSKHLFLRFRGAILSSHFRHRTTYRRNWKHSAPMNKRFRC
jgi:hypothetical protein